MSQVKTERMDWRKTVKGKVLIDAGGLRALRDHALKIGTLEQWTDVALEWIEQAEKACVEEHKVGEQYRQNWLRLQNIISEDCLENAVVVLEQWKERVMT